jgi:hypothetical protein
VQENNETEKEYQSYFRKSDRVYSLKPNGSITGSIDVYVEKKNKLISAFQRQREISKLEGTLFLLSTIIIYNI